MIAYTANVGNYDVLKDPLVITPDCDHICIGASDSQHWRSRGLPEEAKGLDDVMASRYCKIMAHKIFPDADFTVWIDATYSIAVNLNELTELALRQCDVAAYPHFHRDCVYDEADEAAMLGVDDKDVIIKWVQRLLADGYPAHKGLHDSSILIRRHNAKTIEFNEMWWDALKTGSRRDQLSFDYILWKLGIDCWPLGPGYTRDPLREPVRSATPHFTFTEHPSPPKMDGNKPFRIWLD